MKVEITTEILCRQKGCELCKKRQIWLEARFLFSLSLPSVELCLGFSVGSAIELQLMFLRPRIFRRNLIFNIL